MLDGDVFLNSKSKNDFPVFLSRIYVFPVLVEIITTSKYLLFIFKSVITGEMKYQNPINHEKHLEMSRLFLIDLNQLQ